MCSTGHGRILEAARTQNAPRALQGLSGMERSRPDGNQFGLGNGRNGGREVCASIIAAAQRPGRHRPGPPQGFGPLRRLRTPEAAALAGAPPAARPRPGLSSARCGLWQGPAVQDGVEVLEAGDDLVGGGGLRAERGGRGVRAWVGGVERRVIMA